MPCPTWIQAVSEPYPRPAESDAHSPAISERPCFLGEDSRVLVKDVDIKEMWKSYFEGLLKENHPTD